MVENIFLIGPRASGKTSVGRILAAGLNADFVDTDRRIVEIHRREIADMVASDGWEIFRQRESEVLKAVLAEEKGGRKVVATGGGLVLAESNRDLMRNRGLIFYLSATVEELTARLTADPAALQRPSLTGRGLLEEVAEIMAQREELYKRTAHHSVDAHQPPERVAADILSVIKS